MNRRAILSVRGLSFIELLVAVAIFSILSLAVFNALSLGLEITRVTKDQLEFSHKVNRFLDLLSIELQNSVYFYVSGDDIVGFSGKSNEVSFFCIKDIFDEEGISSRKIARVSYVFQEDKLFKEQKYDLTDLSAPVYSEEIDIPLKSLRFYYFNKSTGGEEETTEESELQDEWQWQDELPFGVRVELQLDEKRKKTEEIISKEILLPLKVFAQTKDGE